MARKYFGTDGIRGRSNTGAMTPEMAMRVGQAAISSAGAISIALLSAKTRACPAI